MIKRSAIWLAILLPMALLSVAIGGVGWYAYTAAKHMVRQSIASDMQAIANLKTVQIQQWLNERREDVHLILTKRLLQDIQEWLQHGTNDKNLTRRITEQLLFPGTTHYREVSLYAPSDGRLLLSTATHRILSKIDAQFLEDLRHDRPVIEDVQYVDGTDAPGIRAGYFIPVSGIEGGPPILVIHFSMDPGETLFPFLQEWPGASKSAETLLFRNEGEEVIYINTLRHIGDAPLKLRRALSTPNLIAARLIAEGDGFFEANDYRGIASLAYGLHVAGTPWFLIAKIDREEAYRQINTIAGYSSLLLGVLMLVCAWWLFARKRAEMALTSAFREIEDLYENAPCGYHSLDRHGEFIRINATELKMLGYAREEVIGKKKFQDLLTEQSLARFSDVFPRFLAEGLVKDLELEFIRKDGTYLPAIVSATAVRGSKGEFLQSRSTLNDLSRYKRVVHELRLSEERYRGLFGSIRDAVFVYSLRDDGSAGCFVVVNDVACERLGYSRDELLRMTPADIDAPNCQPNIKPTIEQLVVHSSIVFECTHVTKDGRSIPVEVSASLFVQSGQSLVVALARDITERKRAERELIDSREQLRKLAAYDNDVREEERKRIAREVHDELGQLLTALRMDIVMLQMRFDEVPGVFDKSEQMLALVEKTIKVARHVTSHLRPPVLDSGIVGALDWLAEDFTRRTNVQCSFDQQLPDLIEDDTLATTLFRIAQESLTNVTRYAFARNVRISLVSSNGLLKLTIEDDGCGFNPSAVMQARNSFGLLGMHERAISVKGTLCIDSAPGRGTRVEIEVPLREGNLQ